MGAWCTLIVYVANLNVLYLQSTALTEPVLLAFLIGAIYHLACWMRTRRLQSLAMAGLLTFCASLTRYEGWVLVITATAVVIVWTRRYPRSPNEVQANALVFVAIGGYGIVLWVLYNLIIFHDPLYFMQSAFSAAAQQTALAHVDMLGTKGNLHESVLTYGWAMLDLLGPVVTVGAVGAMVLVVAARLARGRTLAVLLLLSGSVVFNIVSLWLGQSTLRVPQLPPGGMFNDRYGIMALPLAAVALGIVAARWRSLAPVVAAVAVAGVALMSTTTPLTIADGRVGASSAISGHPDTTATYLHLHYRGGEVLADDSRASPFMFESGLDLRAIRHDRLRTLVQPGLAIAGVERGMGRGHPRRCHHC